KKLPADFVLDSEEGHPLFFLCLFRKREFDDLLLKRVGLLPLLQPDIKVPQPGEGGQVVFVQVEDLFQVLNRLLEPLRFFEVPGKGEEDFDVLFVKAPGPSVQPDRFVEIIFEPVDLAESQEGADMVRVEDQDLLKEEGGVPVSLRQKGIDRLGIVSFDLGLFFLKAGVFPIQKEVFGFADAGGENDEDAAEGGGEEDEGRDRHFKSRVVRDEKSDFCRVELGQITCNPDEGEKKQNQKRHGLIGLPPFSFPDSRTFLIRDFRKGDARRISPKPI